MSLESESQTLKRSPEEIDQIRSDWLKRLEQATASDELHKEIEELERTVGNKSQPRKIILD